MKEMESIAKKIVIISTPNGFQLQEVYDNNPLQKHQSAWFVGDFIKRGYKVRGIGGLYILKRREKGGSIRFKPAILWKVISDITQKLSSVHPRFDYQLFCEKNISFKNITRK